MDQQGSSRREGQKMVSGSLFGRGRQDDGCCEPRGRRALASRDGRVRGRATQDAKPRATQEAKAEGELQQGRSTLSTQV